MQEETTGAVAEVRRQLRLWGFEPKAWHVGADGQWLMMYEHVTGGRDGGSSDRHYIGLFNGTTEILRHPFHTDNEARTAFEIKAEARS